MKPFWRRIRPLLALVAQFGRAAGARAAMSVPAGPDVRSLRSAIRPDERSVMASLNAEMASQYPETANRLDTQSPMLRDGARWDQGPAASDGRAPRHRACARRREHPHDRTHRHATGGPPTPQRRPRPCRPHWGASGQTHLF